MVAVRNTKHIFKEVPTGFPEPDKTTSTDTSDTIDLESVALDGGFLVKTLVLSIDPYLRHRMRESDVKGFAPPFTRGEPLDNYGVGVVVRSEDPAIKAGQRIYGWTPFVEYFVTKNAAAWRVLPDIDIPPSAYVGVAGMPGQTAFCSWKEFSRAKAGEVAFVSAGAGAVGSAVVQLAKLQGLKVISSAGSDEKVKFMKDIGADVAFNYKTTSTPEVLKKEGPINIYFDNVGGETLEAALDSLADDGRVLACGSISSYNGAGHGVRNFNLVFEKTLQIYGILVGKLLPKYQDEFYNTIPADIAAGKLKYNEHKYNGLESVGRAILDVQTGKNTGKSLIIVAEN